MSDRDRSQGWQHAKISGHENEDSIKSLLQSDEEFLSAFLDRIQMRDKRVTRIDAGGIGQSRVQSIFSSGEKTTPKADLYIEFSDNTSTSVSIKKSLSGQVYLVTIKNFIEAYEHYYEPIPNKVKLAINLFWGSDPNTQSIIDHFGTRKRYELRKHRLVSSTLLNYDLALHNDLIAWFANNSAKITELCFSRGGARNKKDWAEYVWYINEVDGSQIDAIFKVSELCEGCQNNSLKNTSYGTKNGGSTIQLPFGFVQWHSPSKTIPGSMQFHHVFDKISQFICER